MGGYIERMHLELSRNDRQIATQIDKRELLVLGMEITRYVMEVIESA